MVKKITFLNAHLLSGFSEIFRKLSHIWSRNCMRNSACANQIFLHGWQFPQCDNLMHFAFKTKLLDIWIKLSTERICCPFPCICYFKNCFEKQSFVKKKKQICISQGKFPLCPKIQNACVVFYIIFDFQVSLSGYFSYETDVFFIFKKLLTLIEGLRAKLTYRYVKF